MSTYGIIRLKVRLESALTEKIYSDRQMSPQLKNLELLSLEKTDISKVRGMSTCTKFSSKS